MSNYIMWSLIVGFFLPPAEAALQQSHWPAWLRAVVNFALCCIAALGIVLWQEGINFHDWVKAALTTLVTAIAVYKGLWSPTRVSSTIESKTNFIGNGNNNG